MKIHICLHKVWCKTIRRSLPFLTRAWSTKGQSIKSKYWTCKGMGQLPGTQWQSRGRRPDPMNIGTFCLFVPPMWRQHVLLYLIFLKLVCKLLWAIDRVTNYLSLHWLGGFPRYEIFCAETRRVPGKLGQVGHPSHCSLKKADKNKKVSMSVESALEVI